MRGIAIPLRHDEILEAITTKKKKSSVFDYKTHRTTTRQNISYIKRINYWSVKSRDKANKRTDVFIELYNPFTFMLQSFMICTHCHFYPI